MEVDSGDDGRDEPTWVGWEDCEGVWLGWWNEARSWFQRQGDQNSDL